MSDVVSYECAGNIGVITINNPPVNAMSYAVRLGLWRVLDEFLADPGAAGGVLICTGRTFIAGADITEFDRPPEDPWLPKLLNKLEASPKPMVAALHGTALGGGFETALACHYRCALSSSSMGLPEVNLGLLPGAGGTQRLPRLTGIPKALDMILSGKPVGAAEAKSCGVIDEIIDGDLREGAIAYARRLVEQGAPVRRLGEMEIDTTGLQEGFFEQARAKVARESRGFFSPKQIINCLQAAAEKPFTEALELETRLFNECKASPHSRAQRYLFFAERTITKIPDIPKDTPLREINSVGIIGAGTMGSGIAINFLNAGIPVILLEMSQEALDRGIGRIRKTYSDYVDKGRLQAGVMDQRMALLSGSLDYQALAGADLVIEAVFEDMKIKREVFSKLDQVCKPTAILATNTSSLDVNEIAGITKRPEDVIGLHFFAPANIMVLLEIVRGAKTAKDVIATSMALARRIKKTAVLVGVCFGFVGNRVYFPYIREADFMMLEGVAPERIDRLAYDWGMAMGPLSVVDLSGIDVFHSALMAWRDRPVDPVAYRMLGLLREQGRLGQKTGAGYFGYDGRKPVPDAAVVGMARREAERLGVPQREVEDEEIIERLLFAMVNEGARVLDEGIALRACDIDVVFTSGYGMPRYRGGPMIYADMTGLQKVYDAVCKYRDRYGDRYWTPAPLLEQLVTEGRTFEQWSLDK
ncbi:MAG: 3-hydroxyacyl-CoA dehydrogenase [Gammaproteobacteria bacterium RIFCSPLOWO2_02_FULL_56_15]|nr:MAG: 3-hydroxyacyl-CoA dehydrogenase [Gammaproteobacteria bacterium RIFCSPLOWO2_02_FULL_56_15]